MPSEPQIKQQSYVVEPQTPNRNLGYLFEVSELWRKQPSAVPMLNTLGVRKMQSASGLNGPCPKFQSPKVIPLPPADKESFPAEALLAKKRLSH